MGVMAAIDLRVTFTKVSLENLSQTSFLAIRNSLKISDSIITFKQQFHCKYSASKHCCKNYKLQKVP